MVEELYFGFYQSPFGRCLIAETSEGLAALLFHESEKSAKEDLMKRFKGFKIREDEKLVQKTGAAVFMQQIQVKLALQGTEFQKQVWHTLLGIPTGKTVTYQHIADQLGSPKAVRAVGTAIGANPVAWYIPCHRVLRKDGQPGGYRWGLTLKRQMLIAEGIECKW